jgi:1-acyl-sn-glycerol-3-phosphate acyltransferase
MEPIPWIYRCSRRALRVLFLSYWQPSCRGLQHVPSAGPLLLVCNHPTVLDGLLLGSVLERRVRFLISREPLKVPLVGRWLLALGFLPTGGARQAALEQLATGACIGIFPEAVPTHSYTLQTFHKGYAALAQASGAVVVPVAISGTEELCPEHCSAVRGGQVHLHFCAPLHWEPGDSADRFDERTRAALSDALRARPTPQAPQRSWRYRLSEALWLPLSWLLLKLADWSRPDGRR